MTSPLDKTPFSPYFSSFFTSLPPPVLEIREENKSLPPHSSTMSQSNPALCLVDLPKTKKKKERRIVLPDKYDKATQDLPLLKGYQVERSLSQERASGEVFALKDRTTQERWAVKVFYKEIHGAFNEWAILNCFQGTRHALQTKEFGRIGNDPAIVMQYLPYADLSLFTGNLSLELISGIARQAFEFLKEAKKKKIIHGDIKPDNMVLDFKRNYLTIMDFNLSVDQNKNQPLKMVTGTRFYLSPEIIVGQGQYNEQTDIWSLGLSLFELYVGKTFFSEESSPEDVLASTVALLGVPPNHLLKTWAHTTTYYSKQSDGSYTFKKPSPPFPCWKQAIFKKNNGSQESKSHLEELIDLIEKMVCYEKRITPSQALKHPFVCHHKTFSVILEDAQALSKCTMLFYKDPSDCRPLLKVDLADPPLKLQCLHIPSRPKYFLHIEGRFGKLLMKEEFELQHRAQLIIKKGKERGYEIFHRSFKKKSDTPKATPR